METPSSPTASRSARSTTRPKTTTSNNDVVGIDEHRVVHVAPAVLTESDGPMLRFGLQDFHGQPLREVPRYARERPDPDRLRTRFEQFLARAG